MKQTIYFHLENKFSVKRNEIPEKLAEFQGGLEKIFGIGARFIEIFVIKNLHSRIGFPLIMESEELEFVKYLDATKEGFRKKPRETEINK